MTAQGVSADSDDVEFRILSTGELLPDWTDYQYTEDFLTPSDSCTVNCAGPGIIDTIDSKVSGGERIRLVINGRGQSTSVVDVIDPGSSRDHGDTVQLRGRDPMSALVDGTVNPVLNFRDGDSLFDVITTVAGPLGFQFFARTNLLNRNAITGNDPAKLAHKTTKITRSITELDIKNGDAVANSKVGDPITITSTEAYDPSKNECLRFLKTLKVKKTKVHPGEGAFEFLARLLKRFNLWLWPNALGDTIIVGAPDFEQAPSFQLYHSLTTGRVNVLNAKFPKDLTNQPSAIVAVGHGAGGDYPHSSLKVAMVNELTGVDKDGNFLPEVLKAIQERIGTARKPLAIRRQLQPYYGELNGAQQFVRNDRGKDFVVRPPRIMDIEDDESQTLDQLEGFVRTEMAKRQHKARIYKCTVVGHTQNGKPWAVDTIADVNDEKVKCFGRMWVKSRTFVGSRSAKFTHLELVRPYTIEFGVNVCRDGL